MKVVRCIALGMFLSVVLVKVGLGQGLLTPPAGPEPMMKSLDQVEPRVPLGGSYVEIWAPGSYYLVENMLGDGENHGILIGANNVTLDLNGFMVLGRNIPGTHGIVGVSSLVNVVIKNGFVMGWGDDGIHLPGGQDCRVLNVSSFDNADRGFDLGEHAVVRACVAGGNGGVGVYAGRGSWIDQSHALDNSIGFSIYPVSGRISESIAMDNTLNGIHCGNNSSVQGCFLLDNGGAGIRLSGGNNRLENNRVVGNEDGLKIESSQNEVRRNLVFGNTTNYNISSGNRLDLNISELPETLSWPCSVRLVGVVTVPGGAHGLTIASDDVTIDLNGQAIRGFGGSFDGIHVPDPRSGLVVKNGFIENCGGDGINAIQTDAAQVIGVNLVNNGSFGLQMGDGASVVRCIARENGGQGIHAGGASTIADCTATANGDAGIVGGQGSVLRNSTASQNSGVGLATSSGTVLGCSAWDNESDGIYGTEGTVVRDSTSYSNDGHGFGLGLDGHVTSCRATGNGADGFNLGARSSAHDCGAALNEENGFNLVAAGGRLSLCTADDNTLDGILTAGYARIADCRATGNGADGIEILNYSFVKDCQTDGNNTASVGGGINATGARNRIMDCSAVNNDTGILVTGWFNFIARNTTSGNTTNFSISVGRGNDYGVILANPGEGFSGTADTSWANFEF